VLHQLIKPPESEPNQQKRPAGFYNEVKVKLEGVLVPDAKNKQRHTPHRRVIQFVEQGAALRVTTTFSGLEGHA